ncbi:cation channel sperm-associated protein subunit gamma-like isoform X2 [Patiria miniata]|uniref:Uncharacterized protein n=1 Tax=Patiria miniata TaxID=46514 RepID=A0A914BHY5_PATMI|nr:cation channel sperm-associated protein subunit gamma-like isoform X2 [Patiria miniata]
MSPLITFIVAICCSVDSTIAICKWQGTVASQDSAAKTAFAKDREALITQWNFPNAFQPIGDKENLTFPYFLCLQVYCDGKLSSRIARTIAFSGILPMVRLTLAEQDTESYHPNAVQYNLPGAVVDVNDTTVPGIIAELSQPAWFVPLFLDAKSRVMHFDVKIGCSGCQIETFRQLVNIADDNILSANRYDNISILSLSTLIHQLPVLLSGRPYQAIASYGKTPTYVIGGIPGSATVILSNSEFITTKAVELEDVVINSTADKLIIHKQLILIGDILEHQRYVTSTNEYSHIGQWNNSLSDRLLSCPYDLQLEFDHLQLYARQEEFQFWIPFVSFADGLHTMNSLLVYQAVVHNMKDQQEDLELEVREGHTYDPFYHWRRELLPFMVFNDYMFRNRFLSSDIVISPLEYSKVFKSDDKNVATTMPDEIFLDCWESFHFVVSLTIDENLLSGASSLDELWITLEVSDQNLIDVSTKREEVYVNSSVKYQLLIADKGSLQTQLASGVGLHRVSVSIEVWMSQCKCSACDSHASKQLQPIYQPLLVLCDYCCFMQ